MNPFGHPAPLLPRITVSITTSGMFAYLRRTPRGDGP